MSNLKEATDRYLTTDFKNKPVLALVALIGLGPYKKTISSSIDTYGPILTGIALYRHLPHLERSSDNKSILELEGSPLQSRLMGLLTDLSFQPHWHLWSLSNDKLMEFFSFNSKVESATGQFNPLSFNAYLAE
ncbi:hypothetical protein [Gallaecimonas xiamenensis]|uniref:hypothetical protein n=1 Tax=Gallaecimonas xiamenensis TaxID=1207039 RepID=UPI0012E9BCE4|nr:hypothetical protein [Gallaecimonas xiamenensis]